jgi:hypothetical protein
MHRTPRTALVTAAVATVLLGAGCTTLVPGLPAPSGAAPAVGTAVPTETDPVAWMGKICTAMLPALKTRSTQPKLDTANPRDTIAALSTYLGETGTAVDGAINGMSAAGPSPIEGGDEAVRALTTTLTAFRDSVREAKTRIDAIDTSNTRALATELPKAIEPLTALSTLPDPAAELDGNPELDRAAAQAPECRQVDVTVN